MKNSILFSAKNGIYLLRILGCLFFQISFCQNSIEATSETNNLVISCPGDLDVSCSQNAQTEFAAWLNSFSYTGGGNVIETDLSDYVVPMPGNMIEVIYMVSDENNFDYCKARFRVLNCSVSNCSYTQGFYGNCNSKACTPTLGQAKAQEIMQFAIKNHGGEYNFGSIQTGNYFKLKLSDIVGNSNVCNNNIFKMLPGGGAPSALTNFSTYSNYSTWSDSNPMNANGVNMGKINNVLLSQTIALFFNLEMDPDLPNIVLESEFTTAAATFCGSNIPVMESVQSFSISQDIINYLNTNYGEATVSNLFKLANRALGNESICSLNHAKINQALDAINRGYDRCRIKIMSPSSEVVNLNANNSLIDFIVFPVPVDDYLNIKYLFDNETNVTIQIFDLKGDLIFDINDDNAYLNKILKIELPKKLANHEILSVNVTTKNGRTHKAVIAK